MKFSWHGARASVCLCMEVMKYIGDKREESRVSQLCTWSLIAKLLPIATNNSLVMLLQVRAPWLLLATCAVVTSGAAFTLSSARPSPHTQDPVPLSSGQ